MIGIIATEGQTHYVYCLKTGKYKFIDCTLGDIYKCLYCVPVAIRDTSL